MATTRTIDHDEIREWVEKNHGYPAMIAGSEDSEMASDNMFPSAPDQSNAGLDLPEAPDLGEELA